MSKAERMDKQAPAEGFPPGEFIRDFLDGRGWTEADLADALAWPAQRVNQLVRGECGITESTAEGLASAFGTTPELWLNLDAAWERHRAQGARGDTVPVPADYTS